MVILGTHLFIFTEWMNKLQRTGIPEHFFFVCVFMIAQLQRFFLSCFLVSIHSIEFTSLITWVFFLLCFISVSLILDSIVKVVINCAAFKYSCGKYRHILCDILRSKVGGILVVGFSVWWTSVPGKGGNLVILELIN